MSDPDTEHLAIATQLTDAVQTGNLEAVAELYADDLEVRQNTSEKLLDKEKALGVVRYLARTVKQLRYDDVRVQPTATGFVQQHVLCGEAPGGALRVRACFVATVHDGRIIRIDEYLDSAQLGPLRG